MSFFTVDTAWDFFLAWGVIAVIRDLTRTPKCRPFTEVFPKARVVKR